MNTHLKSIALSVALTLSAGTAMAHSNSCEVDMNYDIQIDGAEIALSKDKQESVRIDRANNLYLDGRKQDLNTEQKELLADYASDVRALLPVINDIAIDASTLAIEAITDVSTALLSSSPEKAKKIQQRVANMSKELRTYVSDKHLYSQKLEDYLDDNEFEEEVETLVREVVADMVQGNIGNMIAAAIRGDEAEIEAFEAKMEQFGRDMEEKYERKAEEIEARAEDLCDLVEKMDKTEDKFIQQFSEYKPYELVRSAD